MADNSLNSPFDTACSSRSLENEDRNDLLPTMQHADYIVGWICALPIELAASRAMLDCLHKSLPTDTLDTNNYVLGNIGPHNIVMACLGEYGTNNAAHVAAHMTRSFPSIRVRLMVGIGGGVPANDIDLRLGDIVVGRRVMQYDLGKIVSSGQFERTVVLSSLRPELGAAISKLRAIHESTPPRVSCFVREMVQRNPGMQNYSHPTASPDRLFFADYEHDSGFGSCDECDPSKVMKRIERSDMGPRIHYGGIASANQVVKHGTTRDALADELDIICFEMEAAGLMDHFPCLVIRGICDYADSHKNKQWQRYAAANAAGYAKELLMTMISDSCSNTRELSTGLDAPNTYVKIIQRRQKLMDSLSFEQMYWRQSNIKSAHPATCEWFLNHPSYTTWKDHEKIRQHHGFIWVSGKPGSGKSTLMNFLFSQQQKGALSDASCVVVSFFFHARGEELEKSTAGMYRSILFQLLDALPDLQVVLDGVSLIPKAQEPSCPGLNVLQELFQSAVLLLGKRSLICYVDALDECDEDEVRDMINHFEDLCENIVGKNINFKICFSSRHYPYIYLQHGIRLVLENQVGHRNDLKRYIQSRLKTGRGHEAEAMREEIFQKAAGVFMWVVLVVEILTKEFQRGRLFAVRKKLERIPGKLSDIFRDVCSREDENREEFTLSLQWILFSKRPLRAKELYLGVCFGLPDESCEAGTDVDQTTAETFVVSSSRGLAEITHGQDSRVQFIHESVRDFLLKQGGLGQVLSHLDVNNASFSHDKIKCSCNAYISSIKGMDLTEGKSLISALSSEPKSWHALRGNVSDMFPLTEYASLCIFYHAEEAASDISQEQFLRDVDVSEWIVLSNLYRNYEHRHRPNESMAYILGTHGCLNLLRIVYNYLRVSGLKGQYLLLHRAATGFQNDLLKLLIKAGFDVLVRDRVHGFDALSDAASASNIEAVTALVQAGADIHGKDNYGHTPLSRVIDNFSNSLSGRRQNISAIAVFLINQGAEIDIQSKKIQKLWLQAIRENLVELVESLINRGFDLHTPVGQGKPLLSWAAKFGSIETLKLLIDKGADLHATDGNGRDTLSLTVERARWGGHALKHRRIAVVKLLLDAGADACRKDSSNRSPMDWALSDPDASMGHSIINLLVKYGADPGSNQAYTAVDEHVISWIRDQAFFI